MPLNQEANLKRRVEDLERLVRELRASVTPSITPVVQSVVVAQTAADTAQTTAVAAQSTAVDAQTTADTANTAASTAQTAAQQASTDASTANSNASSANTAAQQAAQQAQAAQTSAAAKTKTTWSASVPDNTATPGTADGDVWYVTAGTGGAATAQYRWSAGTSTWTLTPIDGAALRNVVADTVKAGAIDGQTITGPTIRSAATGTRVEMTGAGLRYYDPTNAFVGQMVADTAGRITLGQLVADNTPTNPHSAPVYIGDTVLPSGKVASLVTTGLVRAPIATASISMEPSGQTFLAVSANGGASVTADSLSISTGGTINAPTVLADNYLDRYQNNVIPGTFSIRATPSSDFSFSGTTFIGQYLAFRTGTNPENWTAGVLTMPAGSAGTYLVSLSIRVTSPGTTSNQVFLTLNGTATTNRLGFQEGANATTTFPLVLAPGDQLRPYAYSSGTSTTAYTATAFSVYRLGM